MKGERTFNKRVLFVDDDQVYHEMLAELYLLWGDGSWEMEFAGNAYQALSLLQQKPFKLAVIDINMPVLDGMQLLVMITRRHPDVKLAVMTADASAENRAFCLANGAELFIQKPRSADGMKMVFTMLNELVSWTPGEGFQGMLRQVGLQDVIQMECLGRNSSILEVHNQQMRGRIYIEDGSIIHANVGEQTGEPSLHKLLAMSGGSFQLLPFEKPPQRTIEGSWEFLLMEAARVRDEIASQPPPPEPQAMPADEPLLARKIAAAAASRPRILETLICSGNGAVLYETQCPDAQARVRLMRQIAQEAAGLGQLLPLGAFDNLEVQWPSGCEVTQVRPGHMAYVRVALPDGQNPQLQSP
jgi:CheY-like chemotaxis protein